LKVITKAIHGTLSVLKVIAVVCGQQTLTTITELQKSKIIVCPMQCYA